MTAVTPGREELLARGFEHARQWGASETVVPMLAAFAQAEIDRHAAEPTSELDAASTACLELCSHHSFATGHGDTVADIIREIDAQIAERLAAKPDEGVHHKLDNDHQVFFYEQDFYVLSNFSAFEVEWSGFTFKTSEHLYHWLRFTLSIEPGANLIAGRVKNAHSAHDAFKLAQEQKAMQTASWDQQKVGLMREILRQKAEQHEYVRRKLLATGDRELVEDSWRDDFWGWGPNRDGQNVLGKLWMEVREELRALSPTGEPKR